MDTHAEWIETSTADQREQWFLEHVEQDPLPAEKLRHVLQTLHARAPDEAEKLIEVLEEALAARDLREAVRTLALHAEWQAQPAAFAGRCRDRLVGWMEGDRDRRLLVESAGFDKNLGAKECLRRLEVLLSLHPGTMCVDKTWGFGRVHSLDSFYRKVTIDFERKRGHEMTFAYAGETLQLIGEDHLLARRYRDPEGLDQMIKNDPAEVARIALRSYGPLNAVRLQNALVPEVVPEARWKKFWEGARKGLKKDPLVEFPSKRTDPIRLLDKEFAYDEAWFEALAGERRIEDVLRLIQELIDEDDVSNLDLAQREVLRDRLAFAAKGAFEGDYVTVVKSLMMAQRLGLQPADIGAEDRMQVLFETPVFSAAMAQLPARDARPFIRFLLEIDPDQAIQLMLDSIPELVVGPLGDVLDTLIEHGKESDCAAIVKRMISTKTATIDLLAWLSGNLDRIEQWELGPRAMVLSEILLALEQTAGDLRVRALTILTGRFEDARWIRQLMDAMNNSQRRNFLLRMKETGAFPEMDRRSILGRIIKAYPDLEALMMAEREPASEGGESRPRGRLTSARSHAERQAQLQKLIKHDIPQNSKEIGVARSYGDLRENFEFKAAKERQAVLLRREAELKDMLADVQPTDFKGFPTETAGMGARVVLDYADGHQETYCILGEWDRDEELGIISSTSRLAQSLEGRRPGERVVVPTEHGEAEVAIREVGPLPEEVVAWLEAIPQEAVRT